MLGQLFFLRDIKNGNVAEKMTSEELRSAENP